MRDSSATRRSVLAATGTALLAGCRGLDSESSSDSVPSHRLPDVAEDGESEPIVVETVPVDIERAKLDDATQRVSDLLGTLPMPFGPGEVPNGHIRHRLIDAANDATEYVEDARTAKSRLSALQSLRDARAQARYTAAGWAFVDSDTTVTELQSEHQQAMSDAESFQSSHEYLGTDPVRAALVHARIERNLDYARNDRTPFGHGDSESLLAVAEWGEHAELARALVADSRYLYDQFTASLPADAGTVRETLATAAESVADDLRQRQGELPAEPTEDDRELVWRLRYRLRREAESSAERVAEASGPASAVLAATEGLTHFLAYDRILKRIDDGEQFTVTDASDVRAARSQALEAIRTALDGPRPDISRPVLVDAAATVAFADADLSRYRGDVRVERLADPVRRYIAATARARSVPTARQHVLDALDAAAGNRS